MNQHKPLWTSFTDINGFDVVVDVMLVYKVTEYHDDDSTGATLWLQQYGLHLDSVHVAGEPLDTGIPHITHDGPSKIWKLFCLLVVAVMFAVPIAWHYNWSPWNG